MKSGIVFLIHWAICFVITVLTKLVTDGNQTSLAGRSLLISLISSAIIAAIIWVFRAALNVKEGFLFKVSPAKEKCMREQVSQEPSAFNRTCGCCPKDTRGVGSCSPFPMTPGNWPYRADEFSSDFKSAVPPVDSCECDNQKYFTPSKNKSLMGNNDGIESNFDKSSAAGPDVRGKQQQNEQNEQKVKNEDKSKDNSKDNSEDNLEGFRAEDIIEGYTTNEIKNSIKNANINMYVLENCPACNKTKEMFNKIGIDSIKINNAKEHLEMLKEQGVKGVPHFTTDNGSHTGGIKNVQELVEKLNITLEKDILPGKENFSNNNSYDSTEKEVDQIQYSSPGKLSEHFVNQYIENFVPNYKENNYFPKPAYYTGYYSYEQFLPDTVKYGSLAGQFTPPAPCGVSQNGIRAQ